MKFTLMFKTPDVLDQIVGQINYPQFPDFNQEVADAQELAKKFVEYGEYIRVEFDMATETAKVIPL